MEQTKHPYLLHDKQPPVAYERVNPSEHFEQIDVSDADTKHF